jgi:hypothetical protein
MKQRVWDNPMDIYILAFVCSLTGMNECVEIRDNIDNYKSLAECKLNISRMQKHYNTENVQCIAGDMIEDDFETPTGA